MKNLFSILIVSSVIVFNSMPTQAANLEIDYLMLDSEFGSENFDTTALQLKLVNPISPNADIEGVIAFGLDDDSLEETETFFDPTLGNITVTATLEAQLGNMIGVFIKGHTGNDSAMQFFGRIGFAMVQIDYDATLAVSGLGSISDSGSEDDSGIAFGFGAAFAVSDTDAFTIEYSQLPDVDFEGIDIETTALSLGYQMSF